MAADRPVSAARRAAMTARLIYRSLTVRGSRLGIALGSIAVGAAVVSALSSLYLDISIKMSEELRAFGANVIITPARPADGSPPAERGIPEEAVTAVRALAGDRLVGVGPVLYGLVRLDLGNAVMAGVDFTALRAISPYWQVEGGWITASFDDRNAMVGRRLAEAMELSVGMPVTVRNGDSGAQVQLTVKGIIDTGDAEDDQIFVNLPLAQHLLGLPGRVDLAMASVVAQGREADALTARLSRDIPGIEARPIRKISQADGQILDKIEGLMALIAAIILAITTLCVNATLSAMIAERAPQIGLQKAIGASDGAIVGQVLAETAALSLAAVAIGLACGFVLAQGLGQAVFGAWVAFRPGVVPLTLLLLLAAALVAAILPVRRAVRIVPAQVLRGE